MQSDRNKPIHNWDLQSRVVSVLHFDNYTSSDFNEQAAVLTRPWRWLVKMGRFFFNKARTALVLTLVVLLSSVPALAGLTIFGSNGITASGADGVSFVNTSGITASGADSVLAFKPNGITASGADGITASGADGITVSGADGITASGADSTTINRADSLTAVGPEWNYHQRSRRKYLSSRFGHHQKSYRNYGQRS